MSIIQVIAAFLKLVGMFFGRVIERDKIRKIKLKEASDEVREGIKKRDPSLITGGFDSARRVRHYS